MNILTFVSLNEVFMHKWKGRSWRWVGSKAFLNYKKVSKWWKNFEKKKWKNVIGFKMLGSTKNLKMWSTRKFELSVLGKSLS